MDNKRIDEYPFFGSLPLVDCTSPSGSPYDLSGSGGAVFSFLTRMDGGPGDPAPSSDHDSSGRPEPRNWRLVHRSDLDPRGRNDRRMAIQFIVDHQQPYESGQAPYGQPEFFTQDNSNTRVVDEIGRVAIRPSHERIVGSEDNRYAIALTLNEIDLGDAVEDFPQDDPARPAPAVPPGVMFHAAGREGGVTRAAPSVSIGGVTFFGNAAINAAKQAIAAGGTANDVAQAARAAAFGLPPPPVASTIVQNIFDPGSIAGQGGGSTTSPEPARNAGGSVDPSNIPAGYVTNQDKSSIGLLGTVFTPSSALGAYFFGREGEPIGPLPIRHDAQFAMRPKRVGRIMFVGNDAASVEEGSKPFKGAMWFDTTRANIDTELGFESGQWRPVVWVSSDLPPFRPPPKEKDNKPDPPPGGGGGEEKKEEEKEEEQKRPETGGGTKPAGGGGGGGDPEPPKPEPPQSWMDPWWERQSPVSAGGDVKLIDPQGPRNQCKMKTGANSGKPYAPTTQPPKRGEQGSGTTSAPPVGVGTGGVESPVGNPTSQERDYTKPGVPCPNRTRNAPTAAGPDRGHTPVTPVPGGIIIGGQPAPEPSDTEDPPELPGGAIAGDAEREFEVIEIGANQLSYVEDDVDKIVAGIGPIKPAKKSRVRIPVGMGVGKTKFEFVEVKSRARSLEEQIGIDKGKKKQIEDDIKNLEDDLAKKFDDIEARRDLTRDKKDRIKRGLRKKLDSRIRQMRAIGARIERRLQRRISRLKEVYFFNKAKEAKAAEAKKAKKEGYQKILAAAESARAARRGAYNPTPSVQGGYMIDTTDAGPGEGLMTYQMNFNKNGMPVPPPLPGYTDITKSGGPF